MAHATGSFDVQITPVAPTDADDTSGLGRLNVMKQFHGDLDANSAGHMLTAGTEVKGSAAYVVVERVTGTLHGKRGSFALVHRGVMDRGTPEQHIAVVPDSGTGELLGLRGRLTIIIDGGKHGYEFDYQLD